MNRQLHRVAALAAIVLAMLSVPALAAAAPGNDALADAIAISPTALPFAASADITTATTEPGEPVFGCAQFSRTVWYSIVPAHDAMLRADVTGSSFFDTALDVYEQTGTGFGGLAARACVNGTAGTRSLVFDARAGRTYYVRAGNQFTSGGMLQLAVSEVQAPANDAFAQAQTISAPPFGANLDLSAARNEPGEPTPCGVTGGSAWYAFSPATSGSVSASVSASTGIGAAVVAAYRGSSPGDLAALGCRSLFGGGLTFRAEAGSAYWFQLAGSGPAAAALRFDLVATPSPVPSVNFSPFDPSTTDTIQFFDNTVDPAGVGVASRTWDFGDGTSVTDPACCSAPHRYAADGTYRVQVTVTTPDGRVGTAARDVVVTTHDVAIDRVSVPASARVGVTKTIAVSILNTRYDEEVTVVLFRSVNGGFQEVARSTQYVAARPRRTTQFKFNYTFSPADAQFGKVNFQAVASIVGARDAMPTDNTYISLPAKVTTR